MDVEIVVLAAAGETAAVQCGTSRAHVATAGSAESTARTGAGGSQQQRRQFELSRSYIKGQEGVTQCAVNTIAQHRSSLPEEMMIKRRTFIFISTDSRNLIRKSMESIKIRFGVGL